MTGPGTYDDRTATREPCVCGRLVTRRALCTAQTAAECPLPPAASHRCASYRREAVQALERFEASVERLTAFVRGEDETR